MLDKSQFTQHISRQYNEDLENLRNKVLAMGGLVETQIEGALESLAQLDGDMAKTIIETDKVVNGYEVDIDEECTRVVAKRQPAAADLRLIMAVIKTITDLERIGDEAEKIARMASHIALSMDDFIPKKKYFGAVMNLGQSVSKMLHNALDAFARLDVETALHVAQKEAKADKEYDAVIRQLITYMMEDPRSISSVLDVMWSARALERVGDHARNISEYVIYLVKGKDVRHVSLKEMKQVAKEDNE